MKMCNNWLDMSPPQISPGSDGRSDTVHVSSAVLFLRQHRSEAEDISMPQASEKTPDARDALRGVFHLTQNIQRSPAAAVATARDIVLSIVNFYAPWSLQG